ncbi:hypothetical protein KBB96_17125 [Luteolibacter ambystomatis]|uniref:Tyr recombinase domain-containing protein n=1 Tax=Luteolibacter ambystomatis TaxID=2824561 RepID=A0A975G864_9BACT|nr:site-specific integrase [Luteolibacter ambystomatis]QUE50573.1 hypothetical protein KBB96_17125 [Luteolibacter ambystomatis]
MAARKKTAVQAQGKGFKATAGSKSREFTNRALAVAWCDVETAPQFRHCRIQFNNEERRPFIVAYPTATPDGKAFTARKKFSEFHAARRFAEERDVATINHGRQFASELTREEIAAVSAWRNEAARLAADGVTVPSLADLIREGLGRLFANPDARKVADLVPLFLQAKTDRGIGAAQLKSLRIRLGRFEESFGDRVAASIDQGEIERWVLEIRPRKKTKAGPVELDAPSSPQSRKHYRAVLHTFFAWVNPDRNPVTKIEAPLIKSPERDHYTPEEAYMLLAWMLENDSLLLPSTAIGFFTGLRQSEIARLDLSAFDLSEPDKEGEFILRASDTKTDRPRAVPVLPVLKHWLLSQTRRSGSVVTMTESAWLTRVRHAHAGANVRRVENGLRHSFASYRGAIIKDSGRLADEMGNSVSIVRRHYRDAKLEAEARAFFSLKPGELVSEKIPFKRNAG